MARIFGTGDEFFIEEPPRIDPLVAEDEREIPNYDDDHYDTPTGGPDFDTWAEWRGER